MSLASDSKWGDAERGTHAGIVTWSIAPAGVHVPDFGNVNPTTVPTPANPNFDVQDQIRDAFDDWSAAANIEFIQVAEDSLADFEGAHIRIFWGSIPNGTVGWAYYPGSDTAAGDIFLDSDFTLEISQSTFKALALHEIGHAIGLDHGGTVNTSVMTPSIGRTELGELDISSAQDLYGPQDNLTPIYTLPDKNLTVLDAPQKLWIEGNDADNRIFIHTPEGAVIRGLGGDDVFNGGGGFVTAQYRGFRRDYEVSKELGASQVVHVNDFRFNRDGRDQMLSVERLEFRDGTIAFDEDGNAGQAYRLYQAAFDRVPDAEGLGFWIDHYDQGSVDLVSMANFFMRSAEFAEKYGDPDTVSDFDFLTLLYNNVLDRDPDQAGFLFWRNQQENGLTRAEMIQYFSESNENYENVAADIAQGIWFV